VGEADQNPSLVKQKTLGTTHSPVIRGGAPGRSTKKGGSRWETFEKVTAKENRWKKKKGRPQGREIFGEEVVKNKVYPLGVVRKNGRQKGSTPFFANAGKKKPNAGGSRSKSVGGGSRPGPVLVLDAGRAP